MSHAGATRAPPTTAGFGRFFLPGPTEVRPEVLAAMGRPMIGHRGPDMVELLASMGPALGALFGSARPVFVSTSSATGLMETAIVNLSARRVLCLVCGAFGGRFLKIAARTGRPADALEVEWGAPNLPTALRAALAERPGRYDLVTVVQSETSTGVLNPIVELAAVTREYDGVLLAVDGVSSVGGVPFEFDAWGVDFALTGSQKALALPPGLAFGVASERALERAAGIGARSFYFDLLELDRRAREHQTLSTPAISLLHALACQLERIGAEGIEARWARHAAMAARMHTWTEALAERSGRSFAVLAPPGYRSPTVTAMRLPEEVSGRALVAKLAGRGYTISPGYGKLRDTTVRVGHMGDHTPTELDELLDTLESILPGGGS